jgi:hypothetical protein
MQKYRLTMRYPAETIIRYVVEVEDHDSLVEVADNLRRFASDDKATAIHRIDELTGDDGAVLSVAVLPSEG